MKKEMKNMFDDIEPCTSNPSNEESSANLQEPTSKFEQADINYMQMQLEMQRNIKEIQDKVIQLQKNQEKQALLQNTLKEVRATLSIEDREYLSGLPRKMYNASRDCQVETTKFFKQVAIPQLQSMIKDVDDANEARMEKTKKELEVKKGVYMSTSNFWAWILLTFVSCCYSLFRAFQDCLWGELWDRIWLPFLTIASIFVLIFGIVLLNIRD